MPGILPMKVIKVGSSAQSRIAQACDRCRSKKIRCDGIRPCCTQCANVGFECKTSDKLSRRAFPRGYTESLEERVRQLEAEVRELKDLLDEKDEKIDVLAKMHDHRRPSSTATSPASPPEAQPSPPPKEDVFRVQTSPVLLSTNGPKKDSFFMGPSSGRLFVDALKRKIQENGKSCTSFNMTAFFHDQRVLAPAPKANPESATVPSRLFSDKCVNVFFQEWSPLFPVLHKPTFLQTYETYVTRPQDVVDKHQLAHLHLVFALAGLSNDSSDFEQIRACESEWISALDSVVQESSLSTLQCLVLAMLYCIATADYEKLLHYKGIAVGMAHRLGLHQPQKRFSFGALSTETRKRVFWTLYTVDCFSAALLGLPKLLKEEDIETEYPIDIDDEYVTERGFQPTLPGEYTKISSSLALLRACRILARVMDQLYPSAAAYDLTLQTVSSLDQQINEWFASLPSHLKLTFAQDKPSTDITGNRSAFLSLTYYYIRTLIHRPVIGSSLGSKASASVLCVGDSSRHIVQILQLLRERSMSFTFCLNKNEMLVLCGLSILYRSLDLKQDSKLAKDGQRYLGEVSKLLAENGSPAATEFATLTASIMSTGTLVNAVKNVSPVQRPASISSRANTSPSLVQESPRSSRRSLDDQHGLDRHRRATLASVPGSERHSIHQSVPLDRHSQDSDSNKRENRASVPAANTMRTRVSAPTSSLPKTNLDYLPLSNPAGLAKRSSASQSQSTKTSTGQLSEWESLLGSLDGGQANIYDAMYGGPPLSLGCHSQPSSTLNTPEISELPLNGEHNHGALPQNYDDWSPDAWGMSFNHLNLGTFSSVSDVSLPFDVASSHTRTTARSVLSFSDESLSSGGQDDLATGENTLSEFGNTPFIIDGLDANFGL